MKKNYQSFPRCVARKDLFCLVVVFQFDDGTGVEHGPETGKPSSHDIHWRGDVGLYAGDVGLYAGEVGDVGEPEKLGEVGE